MAGQVYTMKVCHDEDFLDWKSGKNIFLVKDQCFISLSISQERLDYMMEVFEGEEDIPWDELTPDEKKNLFIRCLDKEGVIPVTYEEYEKHPHVDPVHIDDLMLFWTFDNSLDVNDDTYIEGSHTVNMSKVMKLLDPNNKYTKGEMINVYNAVYPFIKRYQGENQDQTENN